MSLLPSPLCQKMARPCATTIPITRFSEESANCCSRFRSLVGRRDISGYLYRVKGAGPGRVGEFRGRRCSFQACQPTGRVISYAPVQFAGASHGRHAKKRGRVDGKVRWCGVGEEPPPRTLLFSSLRMHSPTIQTQPRISCPCVQKQRQKKGRIVFFPF